MENNTRIPPIMVMVDPQNSQPISIPRPIPPIIRMRIPFLSIFIPDKVNNGTILMTTLYDFFSDLFFDFYED